jgi:hypothetical protein
MGYEIIYSFWEIVWNILVWEAYVFRLKKKQAIGFLILFRHPWY